MTRPNRLLPLLGVTLGLAGCQPHLGYLEIEVKSSPPLPVSIHNHSFEVPVGVAVLIHVEPVSDNINNYVATDSVELTSQKSSVLDVEPGPDDRTFVLVGASPGDTCVEVYINGASEECIPATVLAPM